MLEATFQVLPVYVRYADLNPVLQAFGAPAILLVWLYVMANVHRLRRRAQLVAGAPAPSSARRTSYPGSPSAARSARAAFARCELRAFHSLPSSPTVRSSPSGTKIGS